MLSGSKKYRAYLWGAVGVGLGTALFVGGYYLGTEQYGDVSDVSSPSIVANQKPEASLSHEAGDKPGASGQPEAAKNPLAQKRQLSAFTDDQLKNHISTLTRASLKSVTQEQAAIWREYIPKLLPSYGETKTFQVARDALRDYEHVVFHTTDTHNLANNHRVLRNYADLVHKYCSRWDVPEAVAEAIISWENSGSVASVSYAGAVGICQMMEDTVSFVHDYAGQEAELLRRDADVMRYKKGDKKRADDMLAQADLLDCAVRHRTMAKEAKQDERVLVNCNLEDAIIYIKYLLQKYEGREDLAIAAYHCGIDNLDDIIIVYVNDTKMSMRRGSDRRELRSMINSYDIKYADLWQYEKTRAMLSGVRTMNGELTTDANRYEALGDEADIYLWKVLSSWVAYKAGQDYTAWMIENNRGSREECAYSGVPIYDTPAKVKDALKSGSLVSVKKVLPQKGAELLSEKVADVNDVAKKKAAGAAQGVHSHEHASDDAAWLVHPELLGYMDDLLKRWDVASGNSKVRLPVGLLSGVINPHILSGEHVGSCWALKMCPVNTMDSHLRGVAFDLDYSGMANAQRKELQGLLEYDFVFDRVFVRNRSGKTHVVLNPRWGDYYYKKYHESFGK